MRDLTTFLDRRITECVDDTGTRFVRGANQSRNDFLGQVWAAATTAREIRVTFDLGAQDSHAGAPFTANDAANFDHMDRGRQARKAEKQRQRDYEADANDY